MLTQQFARLICENIRRKLQFSMKQLKDQHSRKTLKSKNFRTQHRENHRIVVKWEYAFSFFRTHSSSYRFIFRQPPIAEERIEIIVSWIVSNYHFGIFGWFCCRNKRNKKNYQNLPHSGLSRSFRWFGCVGKLNFNKSLLIFSLIIVRIFFVKWYFSISRNCAIMFKVFTGPFVHNIVLDLRI